MYSKSPRARARARARAERAARRDGGTDCPHMDPSDSPPAVAPGLRKSLVLREGAAGGSSAAVEPGATVRLRYAVTEALEGSDCAAESAQLLDEWRGQTAQVFSVVLSQGDALPCVEAAVFGMAQGEVARFALSGPAASELQQMAPSLTSAKGLTLTMELIAVTAAPPLDLATATAHKDAGNAAFKDKDYELAVKEYMRAVDIVDQVQYQAAVAGNEAAGQETEGTTALQLATLQLDAHNNISLCSIHTGSFAMALHHCNIVLTADSANPKALNRRARAYKGLHDFSSARHDCEAILRLAEDGDSAVTARMTKDAKNLLLVCRPGAHSSPREAAFGL
eukprot:COSAG02_NODE_4166_length_5680_cov_4.786418_3_plen_337_part_00